MCAHNLESHFNKKIIIEQQHKHKYFKHNGNLSAATFSVGLYSQVHSVISREFAVNFGFDAILHTLMYRMLKTGVSIFCKIGNVHYLCFQNRPQT